MNPSRGGQPGTTYYDCVQNNLTFEQCSWHVGGNTYRVGNPGLRLSFYTVAEDGSVGTLITQGTELTYPSDVDVKDVSRPGTAHNRWDGLVIHAPPFRPIPGARYYAVVENMTPPTAPCGVATVSVAMARNCQSNEGYLSINGDYTSERPATENFTTLNAPTENWYGPATGNSYRVLIRRSGSDDWRLEDLTSNRDPFPIYQLGRISDTDGKMYFHKHGVYNANYSGLDSVINLETSKIYRQTIGQIDDLGSNRQGWRWPDTLVDGIWLGVRFQRDNVPQGDGGGLNVTIRDESDLSVLATAFVPVNCPEVIAQKDSAGRTPDFRYDRVECPVYADLSSMVNIERDKVYYIDITPTHSNRYIILGYRVLGNALSVLAGTSIPDSQWQCFNHNPTNFPALCEGNYGVYGRSSFDPEKDFNGQAYVINSTNPAGAMIHWNTHGKGRTWGANAIGTDIPFMLTVPGHPKFAQWPE